MQLGSRESLEDYAARMNKEIPMTLCEKLLNPQRVSGGALDSPFNERVMAEAAAAISKIARIAGIALGSTGPERWHRALIEILEECDAHNQTHTPET